MRNFKVIQIEAGPTLGTLYALTEDGRIWYTPNALANPVAWVEVTSPPARSAAVPRMTKPALEKFYARTKRPHKRH